ncbi:MAG: ribosomal RNA large subunit methyltransferase H [Pseudohongiella sp.]|nr:MAG: ribosomal RNA large subunit methyltransferase H [Pseudohongiella sp.]
MKVKILSVGTKMPAWVQEGIGEYQKRLIADLDFSLVEIPMAKRTKNSNIEQCIKKESDALLASIAPGDYVVALDVCGKALSTEGLAEKIRNYRQQGDNLSVLIGGPDGLGDRCLARASERWSLSAMTFPHPLVRVVITEQFYRAMSIIKGHPYHRS